MSDNPLLSEWSGPFGGVPPFDRVQVDHFLPALRHAIGTTLDAIDRIATDPEPPTFENTIAALEAAEFELDRVRTVASVWRTTMNGPEFKPVEAEMMVALAELEDRIIQNRGLFDRIRTLYESAEETALTPEQQRVLWLHYDDFVRSGAAVEGDARERLSAIHRRLAELSTRFDQNVLADEEKKFVTIDTEDGLYGLPDSEREAAAAAAEARGLSGRWVIENTRSAVEPFLTHASDRNLREQVWRLFVSRGDSEGEHNNLPIIREILELRSERSTLLGYPSHAHWAAERQMAKSPDAAIELMRKVWPAAVRRVRSELEMIRKLGEVEENGGEIRPWDYRYYAEIVRAAEVDLDWDEVKPYLQLEKLREAMFWVAGRLFGLEFEPVNVPVYHPDVRTWEVREQETGKHVGLFYFDPFARPGKKSGAWMSHYRRQHSLGAVTSPIVSNNCNFMRGSGEQPILISWTDARTLFHEFGHALHGLLSAVTYPSVAGTSVPTDFVEVPSQLLEHWLAEPEMLRRFALHYETGEPIPEELVTRIERAARLGRGFSTAEELASGLLDMYIHLEREHPIDIDAFERDIATEIGMPGEMVMRHRPTHFSHIFSSDHYAAKYYSYLWADVLASDAAEAFREAGSMYDAEVAKRLRDSVLSRGNTTDPELAYREFRGRDAEVVPMMRKRFGPHEIS